MASIRKRNGKYQARVIRLGSRSQAKTFLTKADAERWARHTEIALERGHHQAKPPLTLKEALERYAREVTPTKKNRRSETYLLAAWGKADFACRLIHDVKPSEIALWRDTRLAQGKASGTVRNALAALSALFRHANQEWDVDLDNPVAKLKRPAPARSRSRRVSDAEITAIKANSCSPELPDLIGLAVATGMRAGELVSLRWPLIDLVSRTAHLPMTKNGDSRDVPLSSAAVEILNRRKIGITHSDAVFNLRPHAVSVAFRRAVKRTSCSGELENIRFHDLRHEAVTRLFERGLNTMEVAAISGHRTLAMLRRYTHLRAADLALKLG